MTEPKPTYTTQRGKTMTEFKIHSQADIDDLCAQWEADPLWDLEDTEGYEAHYHELKAFSLSSELDYCKRNLQDAEDDLGARPLAESSVVVWTDVYINKRKLSLTARDGATEESVLAACRAVLGAAQTIEASYAERKQTATASPGGSDDDRPF